MLEVDVLRLGELDRDSGEESAGLNTSELSLGNDSLASMDTDNKSCYISELNLSEDMKNSSQTFFVAKLKSKTNLHAHKPYDKLSDREKMRLEEKNSRRAIRIQGELLHNGLDRFSYNIQQLRDDFNLKKNTCNSSRRRRENSTCSVESEISSSFEDEEEIERNFDTWYQSVCDWYHSVCEDDNCSSETHKSNRELVREYMNMEDKVEEIEKELRNARILNRQKTLVLNVDAELEKIRVFKKEIENLTRENELLRTENERLRSRLPSKTE
ncbi:uncharacterized protein TNCV_132461 [Trichonephila clavipes]|nr:uncharacterized protein TNCV_132461 [Trichonephila clavipes]